MKHVLRSLAVVLTLLTLSIEATASTPADTLVVAGRIDDAITFDPAEVFEATGGEVIANVYDRIIARDINNPAEMVGGVAENWSVSDDGRVITFNMRPNLRFHSGRPVTAYDAAFSLQRMIKLDLTATLIVSDFGWTPENVDDLVRAVDSDTLEVETTTPLATTFVLNVLSSGIASVIDREEALAHEVDGDFGHAWLRTNSAGSGPFRLVRWDANEAIVMEANPDYWQGAPEIERVILRHIPEPSTQRVLIEAGDIDIARAIGPDQIAALQVRDDINVFSYPKGDVFYLGLNQNVEVLANPLVRQALRWLIDYDGMAETFLNGRFDVHQSFWASEFAMSLTETPFTLDVERARALLAEAGYPDGFSIELDCVNLSPQMDICQSIQATMAQGGVDVEIVAGTGRQVVTRYRARNHEMVSLWSSPDYLDPHTLFHYFLSNPDNSDDSAVRTLAWRNFWETPELTVLTEAAVREPDAAAREAMYLDMQRRVQQDSPFIIMFEATEQVAIRVGVDGFVSGPSFDTVFYRNVTKQ